MEGKKNLFFSSDPKARQVLYEWWSGLDMSRGDRAALRHCHDVNEVAFTPSFHRLRKDLLGEFNVNPESLAAVAGVLSHVKNNDTGSDFAVQMATPPSGSSNARVSGLRFRRLLTIEDRRELFTSMIRTVRLLDGTANLFDLADSIYRWNEFTKKRWAYDYYTKSPTEN